MDTNILTQTQELILRENETQSAIDLVAALSPEFAQAARTYRKNQFTSVESKPQTRFTWHNAEEASMPLPQIEWRLNGIFAAGGLYMLCGDSGSKKTYFALACALHVAAGKRFLERAVLQKPVLFIEEENGERRVRDRISGIVNGCGLSFDLPFEYASLQNLDIRKQEDINALDAKLAVSQAKMLFIDSLIAVIPGADENASNDLKPPLMALNHLAKKHDCAICVIHHTNKSGGYRGTSAIKGELDGLYMVESDIDSPLLKIRSEKNRDGSPIAFSVNVEFKVNDFGETEAVTFSPAEYSAAIRFTNAERFVLSYLAQINRPAEVIEIKTNHDGTCTENTARQAVTSLAGKGYVKRIDSGGRGTPSTYSLTPDGKEAVVSCKL